MNRDAESVAAGLTHSEHRAVMMFRKNATGSLYHFPALRDGGAMARRMKELKLVSPKGIATKLGLAVRAHLQDRKP